MNNILKISFVLILIFALSQGNALAMQNEKTSRPSAQLISLKIQKVDRREEILRKYLEKYNSPLVPSAGTFIKEADKNGLDWKLVVSIAGVESYFGKHIPYNSNNGWGWGVYGNNVHNFATWNEGITEISSELRSKYMNKWGASSVTEIGSFYAADPNWSNKVTHFMDELEDFSEKENPQLLTLNI